MKKILRTVGILLLCGALACPAADADNRGRNNERGRQQPSRTHQPTSRPGNMGQGNGNTRPGNNGNNNRPATPGQQRPDKPGNNHNRPDKPGQQRPNKPGNNNRPGNNNNNRPGPGGPIGSHRPDYRPLPPANQGHHHGPMRPMPPHHGWYRPAPPPQWRAPRHWRPFRSILGISFGTAINLSINALINNGYTVNSYDNSSVYVSNVPMLNMSWPDAILFYNDRGGLCGSRFMYSTGFYDMNRYNLTYTSLVNTYGSPASLQSTSSGMEATWWGTGNQFIRLSFSPQYNQYGDVRYYTTLSFGN